MAKWEGSQLNRAKEILAWELTKMVHGEAEAEKAIKDQFDHSQKVLYLRQDYYNKYSKFMSGKDAKSMEEEITGLFHDNRLIRSENEKNRKDIIDINKRMERTFQKIGLEKYDAFNQSGGKLSFSLCLLDENDNGFLLNSVHGTDGINYSYSKEINAGIADVELSAEEKKALDMALASINR